MQLRTAAAMRRMVATLNALGQILAVGFNRPVLYAADVGERCALRVAAIHRALANALLPGDSIVAQQHVVADVDALGARRAAARRGRFGGGLGHCCAAFGHYRDGALHRADTNVRPRTFFEGFRVRWNQRQKWKESGVGLPPTDTFLGIFVSGGIGGQK